MARRTDRERLSAGEAVAEASPYEFLTPSRLRCGHRTNAACGQPGVCCYSGRQERDDMTWTPGSSFAGSAVLLVMMILPRTASAALGGTVASVDADRVQVVGALTRIVRNDAFALHEIRSASGITIREY